MSGSRESLYTERVNLDKCEWWWKCVGGIGVREIILEAWSGRCFDDEILSSRGVQLHGQTQWALKSGASQWVIQWSSQ